MFDLPSGFCENVISVSGDASTILFSYYNKLTVTLDYGATSKQVGGAPEAAWGGVSMDETGTVIAGAYSKSYESNGTYESAWYLSTDGGKTSAPIRLVNSASSSAEKFLRGSERRWRLRVLRGLQRYLRVQRRHQGSNPLYLRRRHRHRQQWLRARSLHHQDGRLCAGLQHCRTLGLL
jgi:hypothetical protein